MIPVSDRRARALAAVLLLCSAPLLVSLAFPRRVETCAHPDVLQVTSLIPDSLTLGEKLDRRSPDVIQWSEGRVAPGPDGRLALEFQLIRSYRSAWLMEQDLRVAYPDIEPEQATDRVLDTAAGPLPVTVVRDSTRTRSRLVAYFEVGDRRALDGALGWLVRTAPGQALSGARPLSLYVVYGEVDRRNLDALEARALDWLKGAWVHHREICGAP